MRLSRLGYNVLRTFAFPFALPGLQLTLLIVRIIPLLIDEDSETTIVVPKLAAYKRL
jgi:hypothetical protein